MTVWLFAAGIIIAAAATQSVTGFGFSLTSLPVLTLLYGARDGIVITLFLSAATNLWVSWRNRKDVLHWLSRPLTLGAIVGVIPGLMLYHLASTQVLRIAIGAILVIAAVARVSGVKTRMRTTRAASVATGAISGVLQGSIGLGGPPVSLYLSGAGLGKAAYRSTVATFFVLPNAINLPLHLVGLPGDSWRQVGIACTAGVLIPVGTVLGQATFARMKQSAFERVVMAVIIFSAMTAVYQGVTAGAGGNPSPPGTPGHSKAYNGMHR